MKKFIFYCLFVLMFFIEPSTSNAQFADSLEVPDSLFYMMIDQDSIWTIQAQDSISNFGVYSKNNIESCAKTISYVPTKDEILYNQKDRYILFYSDDFNYYNTSFWKDIDNCSDECWGDPNTRCEADEDQKVQYYKRANVTIDEHYNLTNGSNSKVLTIAAKRETTYGVNSKGVSGEFEFTSGVLKSKYGIPFDNCIIEARIKLPEDIADAGLQPAFWLMGFSQDEYDELDIFEFEGSDRKMKTTVYKHSSGQSCWDTKIMNAVTLNQWHTYRCYWNKAFIAVQVDYKNWTYFRNRVSTNNKGTRDQRKKAIFTLKKDEEYLLRDYYPVNPMRVIFNLYTYKCESQRSNNAEFPQILEMDWIKIWYKVPCMEDLILTDLTQIPQEPNVMNILAGKDIYSSISQKLDDNIYLKVFHTGSFIGNKLEAGVNGYVEMVPTSPNSCINQTVQPVDEDNVETYHSSQKESNEVEFSVYPNPADKEFTLVISADSFIGKVEVYNILGLEVQQYNFNAFSSGINTVNSELWPDGIYFIVLSSASGQRLQEKKLVICQRDQ